MLEHNVSPAEYDGAHFATASRVRELESRLERGWRLIEAEEARGATTDHLVTHFLTLLAEYEAACDRSNAA